MANATLQTIGFFLSIFCLVGGILAPPLYYYCKKHPAPPAEKPTSWEEVAQGLRDALCEHLKPIGLDATVELNEDKTDVDPDGAGIVGSVRIPNRNIDFVELRRWHFGSGGDFPTWITRFGCFFVVQANVEGLKDGLVAEGKSYSRGEVVVDFTWEGKELARLLNSDAELRSYLVSQRKPCNVAIYKRQQFIMVSEKFSGWFIPKVGYDYPEAAFPTIETFEVYDKIGQHIRNNAFGV